MWDPFFSPCPKTSVVIAGSFLKAEIFQLYLRFNSSRCNGAGRKPESSAEFADQLAKEMPYAGKISRLYYFKGCLKGLYIFTSLSNL